MRAIHYCVGGALVLVSLSATAQIVECVDANGKKTYAQTCPNEADQTREITVPKAPVKPAPSAPNKTDKAGDSSWKAKEADFQKRRQERLKGESQDTSAEQHSADAAQRCSNAHQRLDALESGKQAKRVDPVTGEHVPLDSDQRQAELDQLHNDIQKYCE